MRAAAAVVAACAAFPAAAKDPVEGWLGYATGVSPTGEGKITRAEAKWRVPDAPKKSAAFFSPWFGIETADNMNLFQPVNPWTGTSWSFYIEYFQWWPTWNENTKKGKVSAGDILHGVVTYDEAAQTYTAVHTNLNTSESVTKVLPVQKKAGEYKNYTILYVVFEKKTACANYPPNGEVTFYDIVLEYDGAKVEPSWTTAFVDDHCNNRAHIVDPATVQITWDTKGAEAAPRAAADRAAWADFQQRYRRGYATAAEEERRFAVFAANLREAARLQAENPHADFGVTKFSDRTPSEFAAMLGSRDADAGPGAEGGAARDTVAPPLEVTGTLPTDIDWTGKATTPVKDQGECGSCWAFSATEQIETDFMLQKNVSVVLGPQELVDCMGSKLPRMGCTGGNPFKAYQVIEKIGGMELEKDYPYRGWLEVPTCHYKQEKAAVTVADWAYVGKKDEKAMKAYVGTTGPLSVCVNAQSWHSYKSGIMTKCSSTSTDHCVQIVGYGTDLSAGVNGTKYWKVRNSWNTNFGEDGYLRIARGHNLCNINSAPTKTTAGQYTPPQ